MLVRRDGILHSKFRLVIWRYNDRFLSILRGINIVGETIEPLYTSLLRVWGMGSGNLYLEVPHALVILMRRKPWVWIEWRKEWY